MKTIIIEHNCDSWKPAKYMVSSIYIQNNKKELLYPNGSLENRKYMNLKEAMDALVDTLDIQENAVLKV